MDIPTIVLTAFAKIWWLLPLVILAAILKTPWAKGYLGELGVRLAAAVFLNRKIYFPLHNVTLPTADGTTQIDHIYVSKFGIFVVETKNMRGWIFGSEKQANWTQKIYRKSYRFQNPLRQNYKHVKTLEATLGLPINVIHSVVVFVGDSSFKTPMPPNVVFGGAFIRYIKTFNKVVLNDMEVKKIIEQVQSERLAPSLATQKSHIKNLQARTEPILAPLCSKCGKSMTLRSTKTGAHADVKFWGCSDYPACRGIKPIIS